jgi:uncharacterized membrane protein
MSSLFTKLRNKLLAGIAVAVPLLATVWVLTLGYNVVKGISAPWVKRAGITWPGIDFLISILLLLALGFMATHVLGKRLLTAFERLVSKMPIVATIYGMAKQVMDSLRSLGSGPSYKRVVWLDNPVLGQRLMAFATGQFTDPKSGRELVAVFVPTAPNPVTGFVLAVDRERVVDADIPLEDATRFILSAGLVAPFPGATRYGGAVPPTASPVENPGPDRTDPMADPGVPTD